MTTAPHAMPDPKLAPWPFYGDDEVAAVTAILRSGRVNYWTGDEGRAFEADYAAYCGVNHGLALANGTLALELALYGLGIGPGDEVIVPARTFVATASAVVARGATPVVADVDPASQNLTAKTVAAVLSPRTKAIIPVHLAGWPVDMAPLMALAQQRGLKVIEDCAQAHGATDRGKAVGGIGHVGCFSFCQDKIISTGGEGGMVVTGDTALYEKMWSYRDHGKDFSRTNAPDSAPGFKWLVDTFGTNWRLTELQSAIGRLQLKKLPQWVAQRRAHAAILDAALADLNAVTVPRPPHHAVHAYYKYYAYVMPAALKDGWSRDRICYELEAKGVPARVGACPDISREAAFKNAGYGAQPPHPQAETIAGTTIMLPVHPTLTAGNMEFMADAARAVIRSATR
jgi:dTDP-4-amino-4,6-dideoxygalactose transaminase